MISDKVKNKFKELVGKNKLEEAIELISNKAGPHQFVLKKKILSISNRYYSLKEKETKNVISFNEYEISKNKIVDDLLSITNPPAGKKTYGNYIGLGLSLMIAIAFLSYYFYPKDSSCGFSNDNNYKILLHQFSAFNSYEKREIFLEKALFERLDNVFLEYEIDSVDMEMAESNPEQIPTSYVFEEIEKCSIDLVIWGNYEMSFNSDSTLINIKYATRNANKEDLLIDKKYAFTGMKKIKTLSTIAGGEFTGTIEDIILWALGVQSFMKKDYHKAISYFDKIKTNRALSYNAVAECYNELGNMENTLGFYSKTLLIDNGNIIALNNKMALLIKQKEYKDALDVLIDIDENELPNFILEKKKVCTEFLDKEAENRGIVETNELLPLIKEETSDKNEKTKTKDNLESKSDEINVTETPAEDTLTSKGDIPSSYNVDIPVKDNAVKSADFTNYNLPDYRFFLPKGQELRIKKDGEELWLRFENDPESKQLFLNVSTLKDENKFEANMGKNSYFMMFDSSVPPSPLKMNFHFEQQLCKGRSQQLFCSNSILMDSEKLNQLLNQKDIRMMVVSSYSRESSASTTLFSILLSKEDKKRFDSLIRQLLFTLTKTKEIAK